MKQNRKSEVLDYFEKKTNGFEAVCLQCRNTLGCKGACTSALKNHLKLHGYHVTSIKDKASKYSNPVNIKADTLDKYMERDDSLGEF